jgi:hypothetical protein
VAEVLLLVVVAMSMGTNLIDGLRMYMVFFFPWSIPGTVVPTRTYLFWACHGECDLSHA